MTKRIRSRKSKKTELLVKARESMLSAVQIFNNPNIQFKSETFIVLSNIAWMYLMHAYYRGKRIEYRYHDQLEKRKRYHRTKRGAFKYWELERCLNESKSPIDKITSANLRFLIGLRHEIEHQMTDRIDDYLSARFQSCCLNFNHYIKELFDPKFGIDRHLSVSLQFSTIDEGQVEKLKKFSDLPANIAAYINEFDMEIPDAMYNDIRFSYRVFYVPKTANRKGQADKVIDFIKADSPEAEGLNKEIILVKEKEYKKFLPTNIVEHMKKKGYSKFSMHNHTQLWKKEDAKNPKFNYGVDIRGAWYWYSNWVDIVEHYCKRNKQTFK